MGEKMTDKSNWLVFCIRAEDEEEELKKLGVWFPSEDGTRFSGLCVSESKSDLFIYKAGPDITGLALIYNPLDAEYLLDKIVKLIEKKREEICQARTNKLLALKRKAQWKVRANQEEDK